MRRAQPKRLVH